MTRLRLALAAAAAAGAVAAALAASDVRSWDRALARGDAGFAETPARASWAAEAQLPGDPARRILGVGDDLALRRAVQAFVAAEATPRGFENGARRARERSAAEAALADVAARGSAAQASQASDLLGVLVSTAGTSGRADRRGTPSASTPRSSATLHTPRADPRSCRPPLRARAGREKGLEPAPLGLELAGPPRRRRRHAGAEGTTRPQRRSRS